MIGNNFKYSIPEMDRLLDAAADRDIHLSNYHETLSEIKSEGRLYLVQIVSAKINETTIQLMVSSFDIKRRGGAKIISFPKPELINTKEYVTERGEI